MADNVVKLEREPAGGGTAMTETQYDAERQRLRDTYGDGAEQAVNRSEQELAKLFKRSGWTQDQLAKKEGKSQTWVNYYLRFGRFLEFITAVIKCDIDLNSLSEWRFRGFWERTERTEDNKRDDEMKRFRQVLDMMRGKEITTVVSNLVETGKQQEVSNAVKETKEKRKQETQVTTTDQERPVAKVEETKHLHTETLPVPTEDTKSKKRSSYDTVADRIKKKFADEKWYSIDAITTTLNEPKDKVLHVLTRMMEAGAWDVKAYSKQVGPIFHYQMVQQKRLISSADIATKLGPIVKGLSEQSDRHLANVSRPTVQYLAGLLKQLYDEWTK